MKSAALAQLIRTESIRGAGHEDDPVRIVTHYWSAEGELLAEHDPLEHMRWRQFARSILHEATDPRAPGDDAASEFYRGWYAARDLLDETMLNAAPGRRDA
jgi:hypothetical protein